MKNIFPFYAIGEVVKGFGRGSKELGIPTANFAQSLVDKLPQEIKTGIYYGLASVDNGTPYNMVMSIGWNPYYDNSKKSMETHIIHSFDKDFYGSTMKVLVMGYIRPEKNFSSLDELITAIEDDIKIANKELSKDNLVSLVSHRCFQEPIPEQINTLVIDINSSDCSHTNGSNDSN